MPKLQSYFRTAVVLSLCCFLASQVQANPDVKDFFAPYDYERVALSPDGKHFAVKANIDGAGRLVIFETATIKPVMVFKTERRREVGTFWWSNNERLVFTQNLTNGWLDYPVTTGELFALNIDNKKKFAIAGWAAGDPRGFFTMLHPMPGKKDLVRVVRRGVKRSSIAESKPVAYALDTYRKPRPKTGSKLNDKRFKQKIPSPYPWGSFISDNDGEIRIAYFNDEDGALEISQRDKKGEWQALPEFSVPADKLLRGLNSAIIGFDRQNQGFYYLAEGEHQTASLYHYDLKSREHRALFQSPQFDVNGFLLIRASDGEVVGLTLMGTYPETHFFSDHKEVPLLKRIVDSFPYQLVHFSNFSEDGRFVLVQTASDQNPGMLYLFDSEAGGLRPLMQARTGIDPSQMKTRDPFQLKTSDGLDLYGFVTLPSPEAENSPAVVLVHGGPHGVYDNFLFDAEAQYLASQGYAVIQINFRGSGGYGSKVLEAGVGEWAGGMIADVTAAAKWAVQQKIADPDRMCIYGGSYGAFAAISAVSQNPGMYQCAIGVAGVYDLTRLKDSDISFIPWGQAYLNEVLGEDVEKLRQDSPVYHAQRVNVPVFLAHGGEDKRAPLYHAEAMRAALEKTGNSPEWLLYEDEGHGFSIAEHRYEYYRRLTEFLNKHLGRADE